MSSKIQNNSIVFNQYKLKVNKQKDNIKELEKDLMWAYDWDLEKDRSSLSVHLIMRMRERDIENVCLRSIEREIVFEQLRQR